MFAHWRRFNHLARPPSATLEFLYMYHRSARPMVRTRTWRTAGHALKRQDGGRSPRLRFFPGCAFSLQLALVMSPRRHIGIFSG